MLLMLIVAFESSCKTATKTVTKTPIATVKLSDRLNLVKAQRTAAVAAATPSSQVDQQPKTIHIAWDYGDTNNIVFEVWKSDESWTFQHYTNTTALDIVMPADGNVGLFKVRASNVVSTLVSDWATK